MAYQTGTAGGLVEFVEKFRLFGESIGWLTNKSGAGVWYCRDATSSLYFAMEREPTQQARILNVVGTTGYDSGASLVDQPGVTSQGTFGPVRKVTTLQLTPADNGEQGAYWFFGTSTYLHAVWRRPTGLYVHLQIGTLDKKGMNYSGGQYTQANGIFYNVAQKYTPVWGDSDYNDPALRLSGFDTFTGIMVHPYGLGNGRFARHPDNALVAASANAFTGDTVLVPNRVMAEGSNRRRWYVGETPDFAVVSMFFCNPEQILTYGAEEWQVFPCYKKGRLGDNSIPSQWSTDIGYAYRVRR